MYHKATLCQDLVINEMELMYTIYSYTNKNNGKMYIGQTKNTMAERAQSNGNNYKECRRFYNAIKKYGWDSFEPSVLATVDTVEEANAAEEYYISYYNTMDDNYGYNLLPGGLNKEMTDSTRQLISNKAKERMFGKPEANPMYGKKHTADALTKQRECKIGVLNPMFGTTWTETQRERCGTKGKHLSLTDEQRQRLSERGVVNGKKNAKMIRCVEDDIVYSSATEAAAIYGVDVSSLCGAANGKQKTCCGKHFVYVDE